MPEFLTLLPPADALARLLARLEPALLSESVALINALDRVTAAPVTAPHSLPSFPRSTVDGYAVRAGDTFGAGENLPAYLRLAGEAPMGRRPVFGLQKGECALIHTGGMLPDGADAVVMVEHTQAARAGEIEVMRAAAVGENIIKVGEDVAANEIVIPAGVRLRAPEIGGLAALGVAALPVARMPVAGIISTGDEIVPPESDPLPGQVRDVNSYTLSALVSSAGAIPARYGIVLDQANALFSVAKRALAECDLLVITAGSSASTRDLTAQVIGELGQPGVLVHGVSVRPGKPTILAVCNGKAVIGLPGNPVSALVIAGLFVIPVVETLLGLRRGRPRQAMAARLTLNIPSEAGREDWIPVRINSLAGKPYAEPIFGKSNLIFTLARADGLVRIPPDATGLNAGDTVEVQLI